MEVKKKLKNFKKFIKKSYGENKIKKIKAVVACGNGTAEFLHLIF